MNMTKNICTKKIGECASVRTGLVLSRKEALQDGYPYNALSLKNTTEDGEVNLTEIENYFAMEPLKKNYFTQNNDVLLRLSSPYTAVIISKKEENLLIPSHFAIIRVNKSVDPTYMYWWLTKNRKQFHKIASGGTIMGTISSGYIQEMDIELPAIEQQRVMGELIKCANREQQLLSLLATKKRQLIDKALMKSINKGENI